MQTVLNWEKGFFKCTFQILAGGIPVGKLKDSEFSRNAHGTLHRTKINFRTCEQLFSSKADIIDPENNTLIGKITFNPWYPKANIDLRDQRFYWKFSNIWETQWEILNAQGIQLTSRGWSGKGKVEILQADELLVLTGLFIANYYWRLAGVLVACLFPVMVFWF